ncbi:MAG: IspD/TarI family cytidylyltransferase, partial [Hyphomicrobiales bacterium]
MNVTAIIVAAGKGTRVGGDIPKQYRQICGEMILRQTVRAFASHPEVNAVQVVINPDDEHHFRDALKGL